MINLREIWALCGARVFYCGTTGCGTPVAGIYCDKHKGRNPVASALGGPYPGEQVRFVWHGVERQGIVEKANRANLIVVIELNGKRKMLTVNRAEVL
ncbi:MAG: hypothetical protein ACREA9_19780 [Pyrinomonadaceae bacterium]